MERLLPLWGACCALVFGAIATAGPLTPPGAPAPTMKTLDAVEPSIPVGPLTTPGDVDARFERRLLFADHTNKPGAERLYTREQEVYLGMCRRWRDAPKPTIAAVQGACVAGGPSRALPGTPLQSRPQSSPWTCSDTQTSPCSGPPHCAQ